MSDASVLRNASQDNRSGEKSKKSLKSATRNASKDHLQQKIDISKVHIDSLRPWISMEIADLLGAKNDELVELVCKQFSDKKYIESKQLQAAINSQMEPKYVKEFVAALWQKLVNQQNAYDAAASKAADTSSKEKTALKNEDEDKKRKRTSVLKNEVSTAPPTRSKVNTPKAAEKTALPEKRASRQAAAKILVKTPYKSVKSEDESSSDETESETDEDDNDDDEDEPRTSKRVRSQVQPYQSADALSLVTGMRTSTSSVKADKKEDDKIVFFNKGDFLAVRNESGTFYVCRIPQNVYKRSKRFKIQWFNDEKTCDIYEPDFYDITDFECVLTNLKMVKMDKGNYKLPPDEKKRVMNILERAINVEKGLSEAPDPRKVVTDGVDISIIGTEEEQAIINSSPSPKPKEKEKPKKEVTNKLKRSIQENGDSARETKRGRTVESTHDRKSAVNSTPVRERRHAAEESRTSSKEKPADERRSTRSSVAKPVTPAVKRQHSPVARQVDAPRETESRKRLRESESGCDKSDPKHTPSGKSDRSSRRESNEHHTAIKSPRSHSHTSSHHTHHETRRPKIRIQLIPNHKVALCERDPMFDSKDELPPVSTYADSKLLIKAIKRKDYELIDKLIEDRRICSFCVPRSIDIRRDAFSYALQKEDLTAIDMLMNEDAYLRRFSPFPSVLMQRVQHGKRYNYQLPGLNLKSSVLDALNPLIEDLSSNSLRYECLRQRTYFCNAIIRESLEYGVSCVTIEKLLSMKAHKRENVMTLLLNNIAFAIKYGHRDVAAYLINIAIKRGGFGFHHLHHQVLHDGSESLLALTDLACITKSTNGNFNITPVHCASINTNPLHLSTIIESHPDLLDIRDAQGWQPIHYAAVSASKSNLTHLISKGVSIMSQDNESNTPLHLACLTGRVHNVEVLATIDLNSIGEKKRSGSYIDKQNDEGYTPLHIACEKGDAEIVNILLQNGADAERLTSVETDNLKPLMIAAMHGHLNVVKILIDKGVDIEAVDVNERNALIHSVINGHSHIVSYLLRLGASPNCKESHGNTAVHFAVAYGWFFPLKLLIEAGAKLNQMNNCNITPLMIGYVKGHLSLIQLLIKEGVSVANDKVESNGSLMLMDTFKYGIDDRTLQRISFLADAGVDFTKVDKDGNNAFHYLADHAQHSDPVKSGLDSEHKFVNSDDECSEDEATFINKQELMISKNLKETVKNLNLSNQYAAVVRLLLDKGCNADVVNGAQESGFHRVVKNKDLILLNVLVESGCRLPFSVDADGNSILHHFIAHLSGETCLNSLEALTKSEANLSVLKKLANVSNKKKETVLSLVCSANKTIDKLNQNVKLFEFLFNTLNCQVKNVLFDGKESLLAFAEKHLNEKITDFIKAKLNTEVAKKECVQNGIAQSDDESEIAAKKDSEQGSKDSTKDSVSTLPIAQETEKVLPVEEIKAIPSTKSKMVVPPIEEAKVLRPVDQAKAAPEPEQKKVPPNEEAKVTNEVEKEKVTETVESKPTGPTPPPLVDKSIDDVSAENESIPQKHIEKLALNNNSDKIIEPSAPLAKSNDAQGADFEANESIKSSMDARDENKNHICTKPDDNGQKTENPDDVLIKSLTSDKISISNNENQSDEKIATTASENQVAHTAAEISIK